MFGRLTPMVRNILIINVIIFLANNFMPLNEFFSMKVAFSPYFAPYQPFTYMWLHAGFMHIFGNMLAVFFFGPMLESAWGSKRFLIFYLVCGIGSGLLFGVADYIEKKPVKDLVETFIADPDPDKFEILVRKVGYGKSLYRFTEAYANNPGDGRYEAEAIAFAKDKIYEPLMASQMLGASGAVFGILFAFAYLFPNTVIYLNFLFPIKAKYFVLFYGLYELYAEFNRMPGDNVAHLAHLGGMLVAFILLRIWKTNRTRLF